MNSTISKELIIGILITLLFYFLIGACGAFIKDLYDFMTGKQKKIMLHEILIASITSSFISLGLQDLIIDKFGFNIMICLSFIIGVLGFELFTCLNTIQGLKQLMNDFKQFRETKK